MRDEDYRYIPDDIYMVPDRHTQTFHFAGADRPVREAHIAAYPHQVHKILKHACGFRYSASSFNRHLEEDSELRALYQTLNEATVRAVNQLRTGLWLLDPELRLVGTTDGWLHKLEWEELRFVIQESGIQPGGLMEHPYLFGMKGWESRILFEDSPGWVAYGGPAWTIVKDVSGSKEDSATTTTSKKS